MPLDRSQPIPRELVDRVAALPDAQWAKFVRQASGIVIALEREVPRSPTYESRGFGRPTPEQGDHR